MKRFLPHFATAGAASLLAYIISGASAEAVVTIGLTALLFILALHQEQ
jgi:hypothetical protein